jgi:hypothetical protein
LLNTVAASLLVLTLAALLLRGVMRSGPVTPNRIVGAVAVYLLVALLFALLFDLLDRVAPGAFTLEPEPLPSTPAGARFFYLSVITLTSLGLGSVAPLHPFARALVMVEAVVGQFYTTVLVARLVSLEVAHRLKNSGRRIFQPCSRRGRSRRPPGSNRLRWIESGLRGRDETSETDPQV